MSTARHAFVTGFPGFIARRLVRKLLSADEALQITVLCEASQRDVAEAEIERHRSLDAGAGMAERIRVMTGDVTAMDVGLSGDEYRTVIAEITEVYHLAAIHKLGVDRSTAEAVNVQGTRNVLALARAMKNLDRFIYFSSAYVSGDRVGVVLEDELSCGQTFRNPYEATKHAAEGLARNAMERLPVSIIRPSAVVGDSQTGEIDRFDGVYHVGLLVAAAPAAIPLPGDGRAPLNIVPVDYVVDAVHAIVSMPETVGRTFHITDPNPLSARGVYEAVAKRAGKKVARYGVSPNLTKALLRIPGLERLAPQSRQVIDYLNHMAFYNCANTLDVLEGTGIRCPRFESYVDNLVQFARERARN